MISKPKLKTRVRAFSLVEVVVSMVILSLILGSVFGVVWQASDSAVELRSLDARDQEVNRFLILYRQTLESLPVGTSITITPAEESTSGQEEMKIEGAMTAYAMGVDAGTDGETIIALRVQTGEAKGELEDYVGPLYQVAVSREDFTPLADGDDIAIRVGESDPFFEIDDEGRYWLPLLDNIVSMTWRYWDTEQTEWLETWEEETMPEMLELSLLDPWRPAPLRVVFEMPAHLTQAGESSSGNVNGADASQTSGGTTGASSDRPAAKGRSPQDGARGDGGKPSGEKGRGGERGGKRDGGGPPPTPGGGGRASGGGASAAGGGGSR